MPFHFRVIDCGRTVLVRAVGPADPADWFEFVARQDVTGSRSDMGLLVDLRRRETLPTSDAARDIGRRLADSAAARFGAVALVARPGAQYGLARMVDQLTDLEGLPAATFSEIRPAWQWLHEQHVRPSG